MESLDIGTGEMLLQLISAPKTNAVVKNIIAATTHYHTYYVTRLQPLPHLRSDPSCRLHPTSFFILSPLRRPPIVSSSRRHWSNASPQLPGNNHISTPSHPHDSITPFPCRHLRAVQQHVTVWIAAAVSSVSSVSADQCSSTSPERMTSSLPSWNHGHHLTSR